MTRRVGYLGVANDDDLAVSPAGEARVRYNNTAKELQASYDTGAYNALGSGPPVYGEMYVSTALVTNSVDATPAKMGTTSGATTLGATASFDDDTGTVNRLRYTGAKTREFLIVGSATVTASTSNDVVSLSLAKTGTDDATTTILIKLQSSGDQGVVTLNGIISLALNDYIEVFASNTTGTANITISKMVVSIRSLN